MDVHPSRQASKLGVLYPLIRCAIDRALGTGSSADAAFAEATVERMHELLENYPPAADGSTSILTHQQSLALAEAEITRVVGPDPEVWRRLAGSADYRYYELYARWRLSEALLTTGDLEEGVEESASAVRDCESSGMVGLANRIAETAASYGVRSSADDRA